MTFGTDDDTFILKVNVKISDEVMWLSALSPSLSLSAQGPSLSPRSFSSCRVQVYCPRVAKTHHSRSS